MQIAFYTLGCKVNQYDTQMMKELLEKAGHTSVSFENNADCYVINTCSVTNMSDKKSRQMISRCRKKNKDAIIVVCGCFSQISPNAASELDGVDIVIGTANRKYIDRYLDKFINDRQKIIEVSNLKAENKLCDELIENFEEKTRAILKIEDGCQNFCSYCLIPFARGKIRSKSLQDISKELSALKNNHYNEVVLTGIHLASYGKDLGDVSLADAISLACDFGFERVRLGSLEPLIITPEFLDKISVYKNLMPSFHLSLQSGCNSVLKRMNRHYTAQQYRNAVCLLRKYYPNCAVTTDIIVGFPGESDQEFSETLAFAKEISFSKIHIFPFSVRKGTKAEAMPDQVPADIKTVRSKKLEKIEKECREIFLKQQLDTEISVLFEQKKNDLWEGYTENYITFYTKSDEDLTGKTMNVTASYTDGQSLFSHKYD